MADIVDTQCAKNAPTVPAQPDDTDTRIGVTPAVHRVLDALENLREGPLNRAPIDAVLAEVDLAGDTVFNAAYLHGASEVPVLAGEALAMPAAVRMAALLLLGIERAAAQTAAISAGAL